VIDNFETGRRVIKILIIHYFYYNWNIEKPSCLILYFQETQDNFRDSTKFAFISEFSIVFLLLYFFSLYEHFQYAIKVQGDVHKLLKQSHSTYLYEIKLILLYF